MQKMIKEIRFIDLFAGIGGFAKGLQQASDKYKLVWSNEFDKYANSIYRKHFGECDQRDIRTVDANSIPDHDLLCAGFPCQAFSIAGKRRGFDDTRGTLFFEIARILQAKRPSYVLLENVKGLLSHDCGRTFKRIILTLTELRYDLQWQVLNSRYFAVPQNRERIFIIGNLRGTPRPKVFPIQRETGTDIKGQFIDLQLEGAEITKASRTIQSRYYKGYSNRYGENSGVVVGTLRTFKDGGGFRDMKSGLSPTINARGREDGNGQPVILTHYGHKDQKPKEMEISPTLKAQSHGHEPMVKDLQIRRLTPIECERLQGFPDNWTEGISDTQRYKCLGNAVTVNVIEYLGKRIIDSSPPRS